MNTKEIHKIVTGLKANLFKNANSYSIGMLKSHFKGVGLKFKEHQLYSHGDDVRFIDWKMLAKTNNPYVKTFEEDRNVEISVLLDCTSGMFMGHAGKSKIEAAMEITCLLYLLAGETKDYVHVGICTGRRIIRVPKKNGESGIIAFINTLKDEGIIGSDGKVDQQYSHVNKEDETYEKNILREFYRKREIVILSDFYNFPKGKMIQKLFVRSHIHAFKLLTPLDTAREFKYNIKVSGGYVETATAKEVKEAQNNIRIKNLHLEERYLESFIKEML